MLEACELSGLVQACTSLHKHRQENCENTDGWWLTIQRMSYNSMNFAPFKKRIAVLDSAQKSGPDGINNGQYFHTFCTYEIPDSWQKSNFQLYLFVYIYTPSEPAFHADSNALIRSTIRTKLSQLLQFFFSSNFHSLR